MPSKSNAKALASKSQQKILNAKTRSTTNPTTSERPMNGHSKPSETSDRPISPTPPSQVTSQDASSTPYSALDHVTKESGVNKKKQKRRMKEAAKRAAENLSTTDNLPAQRSSDDAYNNEYDYGVSDYEGTDPYEPDEVDDTYYTDEAARKYHVDYATNQSKMNGYAPNHHPAQDPLSNRSSRKRSNIDPSFQLGYSVASAHLQRPPPPPPPPLSQTYSTSTSHHVSKDRIWNTSTAEERERIKEFWLSLGEEERRSLVKVEKEAVLKKMKEQQKHSCSCTVCGRKRTAIEEELEVLYDAYYEELEQYANHQQISLEGGAPMIPPRMYSHPMSRIPSNRRSQLTNRRPSKGRIQSLGDDGDVEDEDYSDEEDEDDLSEDDYEEPAAPAGDFFNFGNSLTVQGGILTVADDLLKNDGKKFIEMMEQLAERRMQREEEAQLTAAGLGHPAMHHGPQEEDDGYDDDEDDEEYDSQEDDEFEEEEMETMTEEQRMEEGRRMFQIFAARMFEQRVLTAYREKVALERQQKLIEELDDESRVDAQREAKKAKEAQKKKDKKRQQKLVKDEEKAKREAERAAEEAASKALEEAKAEEVRLKKEEQRKKREAEKKAQEEEKQRRDSEKQRKQQKAKGLQAEQERKQREQKELEKKKREAAKKREREEREAKEREAREKKDRDARVKAESDANERKRLEESNARQTLQVGLGVPKRTSPANVPSSTVSIPPGLHAPPTVSAHASPRLQIATPVLPKAPTPIRQRQASLQESRNASPKVPQTQQASSTTSPGTSFGVLPGPGPSRKISHPAPLHQPQTHPRYSPIGIPPNFVTQPPGFTGITPNMGNAFSQPFGPPMSPNLHHVPPNPAIFSNQVAVGNNQFRPCGPDNVPLQSGAIGTRQLPHGRVGVIDPPAPHGAVGPPLSTAHSDLGHIGMSRDAMPSQSHSRNTSTSSNIGGQTNLNPRPAPIKRPASVTPQQQNDPADSLNRDVDDLTNHLGSKALLDDADIEDDFGPSHHDPRYGGMTIGGPRTARQPFGPAPGFHDRMNPLNMSRAIPGGNGNNWPNHQMPFGAPQKAGPPSWPNAPGFARTNTGTFDSMGVQNRFPTNRAITIRLLTCAACDKLTSRQPPGASYGFHHSDELLREVQMMKPAGEPNVTIFDMLEICDTEGSAQNGGGSFEVTSQDQLGLLIRHHPGRDPSASTKGGAGDIGSPIVGSNGISAIGGQRSFQQHGGFLPPGF